MCIKTALINIFISTMDQKTTCHVTGVACSDELTEKYHPTLQFLSVLAYFLQLYVFIHSHRSYQRCFQQQQEAVICEKSSVPSTKQQTKLVTSW